MKICPVCKFPNLDSANYCADCKSVFENRTITQNKDKNSKVNSIFHVTNENHSKETNKKDFICYRCKQNLGRKPHREQVILNRTYCDNCSNIITNKPISTSSEIIGYEIIKYVDIVSSAFIFNTGTRSETLSGMVDLVNQRALILEHKLVNAEKKR